MSIKRKFQMIVLVCLVAFMIPLQSAAASVIPADSVADSRMAANIIKRVTEIQNMDRSALSSSEKKELRKELRQMKKQADGLDKRVYLSIGAIIIIILLLILIL
jgi:Holliday junction resolvasome RuvABC ATP-dependent DNA helicase subunit